MPIGAKMYEAAEPSASADGAKPEEGDSKSDDGPIEGEVVDDKKEE